MYKIKKAVGNEMKKNTMRIIGNRHSNVVALEIHQLMT